MNLALALPCIVSPTVFFSAETTALTYNPMKKEALASNTPHSSDTPPLFAPIDTEEREATVVVQWDPVSQIYVGGVVPEHAQVQEMIQANHDGYLRLFGYGSLCWHHNGTGALAHPSVKTQLGRARGYRRCWAQKSTDHRGVPQFPGIVCTLLKDEEVRQFRELPYDEETLTEGVCCVLCVVYLYCK